MQGILWSVSSSILPEGCKIAILALGAGGAARFVLEGARGETGAQHAGCAPRGIPALACRPRRQDVTGGGASARVRGPSLPTGGTAPRGGHPVVPCLGAA